MKIVIQDIHQNTEVEIDKEDGDIDEWISMFKGALVSHTFSIKTIEDALGE